MRIALLSDIHGNPLALDAVLADIAERGGVDAYWVLGDFSSMGYDPVGVLERVTKLPNAFFTRGNHDRQAVIEELQRVKHPAADFLAKFIRGELLPPWAKR